MKICPLITQASILENKELLIHEIDDPELEKGNEEQAPEEESIFINPPPKPADDTSLLEELGMAREARFIAKSYRGQVECLGDLCRFHDDTANSCRLEQMLDGARNREGESVWADAVLEELQKSWEFQQKGLSETVGLFKELEEKTSAQVDELKNGVNEKVGALEQLLTSRSDETRNALESLARALETRTSEIEGKIGSGEQGFKLFRDEVSDWKAILQKNLDAIGTELEGNKKMVEELSENHSGIVELVEHQKKSLADEEKKQQLAEARRLNNAGVMAYHNGQYESALDLFTKAIELDPSFTEAYNNLGLTHTEMNEEKKATEAFRKAIELSPELAATYNNLGYVFYRLGSYTEAVEMYNESIGRSKDNSSAYTNLGNAYYKLERIDEAVAAWKRALEIDPANEKARRNLKRFHAEVK